MEVKKGDAIALSKILSNVKLNKLDDKEVKLSLLHNLLNLRKVSKEATEDQSEIVSKFQNDWKDEIGVINALRKGGKSIEGHAEFLEAERDANLAIINLLEEKVEIELKSVSMDKFISSLGDDDITLEYVAFLVDNGIVE